MSASIRGAKGAAVVFVAFVLKTRVRPFRQIKKKAVPGRPAFWSEPKFGT